MLRGCKVLVAANSDSLRVLKVVCACERSSPDEPVISAGLPPTGARPRAVGQGDRQSPLRVTQVRASSAFLGVPWGPEGLTPAGLSHVRVGALPLKLCPRLALGMPRCQISQHSSWALLPLLDRVARDGLTEPAVSALPDLGQDGGREEAGPEDRRGVLQVQVMCGSSGPGRPCQPVQQLPSRRDAGPGPHSALSVPARVLARSPAE